MFASSFPRVSVLSTCLVLAACGGGGGGSKGDPGETPNPPVSGGAGGSGNPEQPAPVAGSAALSSESYVAITSLFYRDIWANGGLGLGTYSSVTAGPLNSAPKRHPGYSVLKEVASAYRTSYERPFEEKEAHPGDTSTLSYNDCKDAIGIRNGEESLVVRSVSKNSDAEFFQHGFTQDYTFSEADENDGQWMASVETVEGSLTTNGNDIRFFWCQQRGFS